MNLCAFALAITVATGGAFGATPDFSDVPGVVVDHAPVSTKMYLPTSSIIIASNGKYLVAHDHASFDHTTSPNVVKIFESANRGRTWSKISEVTGRWDVVTTVLSHPDAARVGFHYVDWVVDGDDIVFTSRTAYPDGMGGPKDFHDNNFITFHRIKDFRLARRR